MSWKFALIPPQKALIMYSEIFHRICDFVNATPDRKGEVYIACPNCGKESRRTNVHFSFSERGCKCFVCGYKDSLPGLSRKLGMNDDREYRAPAYIPPAPEPVKIPQWQKNKDAVMDGYVNNSRRFDAWAAYKPVSRENVIGYALGYGPLPPYSSRCSHDRLIVPMFAGSELVGIRARQIDCDCDKKWLTAAGSKPVLYNGGCLVNSPQKRAAMALGASTRDFSTHNVIVIVENPVDAILVSQATAYIGVATLGVTIWQEAWTQAIQESKPELVVVVYDNDIAGNNGSAEEIRYWRQSMIQKMRDNPKIKINLDHPPTPNGVRLVNQLLEAKIPARLYQWPAETPRKFDVGSLLTNV